MDTRKKFVRFLAICIVWFAAAEPTVHAETGKRLALLIGNGDYKDGKLISGRTNVIAMKPVLEQIGFEVKVVPDANLKTMSDELESFGGRIAGASAVLFFYSGHGFQLRGESYLLPVGGSPQEDRSMPLQKVLDTLAMAPGAVKLMLLDACRSKAGIEESQQGWAKPQATAEGIVQAFATLSGLDASSGRVGALSPYTRALIGRVRQPGVNLKQFFTDVRNDVIETSSNSEHPQYPTTEGLDRVTDEFLLSPPARIEARVELADDDLIVLLNGKLALNHQTQGVPLKEELRKDLELKSGKNELTLLVSNQKTLRNGLAWERTNGWGYSLRLVGPNGLELTSPECNGEGPCFSGGEEIPFKNGPHHGRTFVVATAILDVDPTSGMTPRVSLRNVKTDLWKNGETPFWAKDQGLLYAVSLTKLPLGIEVAGNLKQFFETIVKVMLKVRVNIPDPDRIYGVVRGNVALKAHVVYCMDSSEWHETRKADFEKSLKEARDGQPEPFYGFVERLNKCIHDRAAGDPGLSVASGDIRVWTAFEDWTKEPNQPGNSGSPSGGQP
jgi:hypothetical protein